MMMKFALSQDLLEFLGPFSGSVKVHSVYNSTTNFITTEGVLFTLLFRENPVPMSIYLKDQGRFSFVQGDILYIKDKRLYMKGEELMDLRKYPGWNPVCLIPLDFQLHHGLSHIRTFIESDSSSDGIMPAVKMTLDMEGGELLPPDSLQNHIYTFRFKQVLACLVRASLHNNCPKILESLINLLGLGHGLTPSGDDFTAGFIWGLRLGGNNELAQTLINPIIEAAKTKTNRISLQFLTFARDYKLSMAQKNLICSLIDFNEEKLCKSLSQLRAWGHSSGIDWMCGLYGGLVSSFDR